MSDPTEQLLTRAQEVGIETTYLDAWGASRAVPLSTTATLLQAVMGQQTRGEQREPAPVPGAPPGAMSQRCFAPSWMLRGERVWGVTVQLYGLRSARNWGMGDFTDLSTLIGLVAAAGGDFVALNPLHALFDADDSQISPYAPSSREFLNVLYLDVTAMRAYAASSEAQQRNASPEFRARLDKLRNAELLDYAALAACKREIFRVIFDRFDDECDRHPDQPMVSEFAQYRREGGVALDLFAAYQALSCRAGFGTDWSRWDASYHDPRGRAVADFIAREAREIRFHAFLQWEAERQLAGCAAAARAAGMRIGLFLDLAVGAPAASAEGWSRQSTIIPGFHIGAPPDLWNASGQDWGLSAYNPLALAGDGSADYQHILARNMLHAGALRVDHVLGFNRLFLIPRGGTPTDGAYLRYPARTLCDAVAAESSAQRCLVVGEDLGTIPAGFQRLLDAHGLLSYRLLVFASDSHGRFLLPEAYPPDALAAFTTHDLPTLRGYWEARDIAAKRTLGFIASDAAMHAALSQREADRRNIAAALSAAGLPLSPDETNLVPALLQFLARTPCRLVAVQLEDLAGEQDQANVPGTVALYPNWRRRLAQDVEAVFAAPLAQAAIAAIRAERPAGPPAGNQPT